jgi:hypothetical protein
MLAVIRREFEDPVEQVMFILGFKHDPKFRTALEAMKAGSNPGILNAVEQLRVHAAILANLCGLGNTIKTIHEQFGSDLPPWAREELYKTIVEEMDDNYGGKWFPTAGVLPEHWINLGPYAPVFRRRRWLCTEVFCLPAPYFKVLAEVFDNVTAN